MITTVTNDSCFDFRGLSTDIKPIGSNVSNSNVKYPIANGSSFFEIDTGDAYMYAIIATKDADTNLDILTGKWFAI